MLEELVKDYSSFVKLDVSQEIGGVQYLVDNMLTRLEEFESVLNMIKQKNHDCASSVVTDIETYRSEITGISKKIEALEGVISIVKVNVDMLEKHVEKAESDFGVSRENKLKMLLKPFLAQHKEVNSAPSVVSPADKIELKSVLGYFEDK